MVMQFHMTWTAIRCNLIRLLKILHRPFRVCVTNEATHTITSYTSKSTHFISIYMYVYTAKTLITKSPTTCLKQRYMSQLRATLANIHKNTCTSLLFFILLFSRKISSKHYRSSINLPALKQKIHSHYVTNIKTNEQARN